MQMRLRNVNTTGRAGDPRKHVSSAAGNLPATFISPPRNPTTAAMPNTQRAAPVPEVEDFTPEQMLAMAEASYAKCPCETCAAYRAFYAQQVAEAQAAREAAAVAPAQPTSPHTPPPCADVSDPQCPPADLGDDLPSPSAPAGSYYFVPRPATRQPQPPQPQPQPTFTASGPMTGSYHRGSLREHLGAVPLLAMVNGTANSAYCDGGYDARVRPSTSPDPAFAMMNSVAMNNASRRHGSGSHNHATASTSAPGARHAEVLEQFHQLAPGHVVELACTQEGKSLLQAALRARETAVIDTVVPELCAAMDTVALDADACHVLRLTVELCTVAQLIDIVGTFHETLVLNMCTVSQYTRRTLQALMDRQSTPTDAAYDPSSPRLDCTPVVEVLAKNAAYLSVTQQGCISLMRVFERCQPAQKLLLMAPLLPSLAVLAFDPFGNYVTQCAVEHSEVPVAAEYVLTCFPNQLLRMSCDKFASNVVEKIIRSCSGVPAVREMLLDELLFNPAALQELVKDAFGNFVVQSIIDSCVDAGEMKRICDRLKPVLPTSPYAVRIEGKLKNKRCVGSTGVPSSAMPMSDRGVYAVGGPSQSPTYSRPLGSYALNQQGGHQRKQQQTMKMPQWQPPQRNLRCEYPQPSAHLLSHENFGRAAVH